MQISQNTSTRKSRRFLGLLIKVALIMTIIIVAIIMLGKIDFPSPNKEIEKTIPNAKLKIVK
jgi:L-asparagine transporter-like permease|tara:strand:- start:1428 stop:1613 length:186 start_codon:yes stop_codon:yes gene_type:complete